MAQLRTGPDEATCDDLQSQWEPADEELNDLVDLMPSEMVELGDALFVALGDVFVALGICAQGETGAPLQQQLDFYDTDRQEVSDLAEAFGWDT